MVVKRTKSGKRSVVLSHYLRDAIWGALVNFLESESVKMMGLRNTNEIEILRNLHYSVLNQLVINKNWYLQDAADRKLLLTIPEAISLMWLLRSYDENQTMLDLKSSIHKSLI